MNNAVIANNASLSSDLSSVSCEISNSYQTQRQCMSSSDKQSPKATTETTTPPSLGVCRRCLRWDKKALSRRTALDFDLTDRALKFARLYAEHPRLGATKCALEAGYAQRCARGAHVRANELLRDPRVIRAVIYFGARALNRARADATQYLARIAASESRYWNRWDRRAFNRLTMKLSGFETYAEWLEKIYERGLL